MLSKPFVSLLLCAVVALGSGCNFGFVAKFKETRTQQVEHVADKALDVKSVNGSIKVWREDRQDVEIVSHLRMQTEERLKAAEIEALRGEDGKL